MDTEDTRRSNICMRVMCEEENQSNGAESILKYETQEKFPKIQRLEAKY